MATKEPTERTRCRHRCRLAVGCLVGLCAVATYLLWPRPPVDAFTPSWRARVDRHFAGDATCKACHAAEFAAHERSGHSHTLTRMPAAPLARELAGNEYRDPLRDDRFAFAWAGWRFLVSLPARYPDQPYVVDWLVGSGTHASTPLSVLPDLRCGVEHRWTWYAAKQSLGLTPAHEKLAIYPDNAYMDHFGRRLDWSSLHQCLGCHSTVVPPLELGLLPGDVVPNVGCERCHGPRKAHVEQARLGKPEAVEPYLRYPDAETEAKRCAECHRGPESAHLVRSEAERARFQPMSLMRSRCYLESPGNLACTHCHDPHDATSTDRAAYRRACLECHADVVDGGESAKPPVALSTCPVAPQDDCVRCHMPRREWVPGIAFHDHWVRVWGQDAEGQP